jgi:spermidine/putrescine transport system substrate-binding protein
MRFKSKSGGVGLSCLLIFLLVNGCRNAPAPEQTATSEDRVVRLYNWADYFDEQILDEFSARTGIRYELETYDTSDECIASIKSDPAACDIFVLDDSVISAMRELRLVRRMDHRKLSGIRHLDPRFMNLEFDPGNLYSIPYTWGTTLLAYRKDRIDPPPTSWSSLFDEAYAGHIMMLEDSQESFAIALISLGLPMNSSNPEDLEKARAKLIGQTSLVNEYTDFSTILDGLIGGTCWVAPMYSGDAADAAETHPEIGYAIPTEGAAMWIDNFAIPRDASNVDEAHAFIDFMLDPEMSGRNASAIWYASPNLSARAFTSEELLGDDQIYPAPEVIARCGYLAKLDQPRLQAQNATWAEITRLTSREARDTPRSSSAQ